MMSNPRDAPAVRSPAPGGAPIKSALARFNYVTDIVYDAAAGGYFCAIATPSSQDPLLLMTPTLRYPAAGNTSLSAASQGLSYGPGASPAGDPAAGWLVVSNALTNQQVRMLNLVVQAGRRGWLVNMPTGSTPLFSVTNRGNIARFMKPWVHDVASGLWNALPLMPINPNSSASYQAAAFLGDVDGVTLQFCNPAGAPINMPTPVTDLFFGLSTNGFIAAAAAPGSIGQFVSDELANQGEVTNVRTTAMSMLASPIGQWANIGGRLIMARTNARNITAATTIPELMTIIDQLNEEKCWADLPISEGGYSWWMPDDSSSYAPHEYGQPPTGDLNLLVCVGRMEPGNSLRLTSTFVTEFYSPKQIFVKEYGPVLTGAFEAAYQSLAREPAVSANFSHHDLIASIRRHTAGVLRQVPRAIKFVQDNADNLTRAAALAATLL